jgi:hypothetical protein
MNALEIIIFVVIAVAILASFVGPLRFDRAIGSIGRTGLWFDHPADHTLEQSGVEEERDAPIPRRPLRARAR